MIEQRHFSVSKVGTCRRCGICCQKGGPCLHHEDRSLIEGGHLPMNRLFTIRPGEKVHDNVRGVYGKSTVDIIKIKGMDDRWTCCFFQAGESVCRIYPHRPLECRFLSCAQSGPVEEIYDRARLSRKDIFRHINGLWDLIETHQERCSLETLGELLSRMQQGEDEKEIQNRVFDIILYDKHFRAQVIEKSGLQADMLDLVFGRSLTDIIETFGFRIEKKADHMILKPESLRL